MSEMFTKCNGFIVSGDPLVYADSATMTGQGTVSEPFGVKSTDLFVQEPLYTGVSGNSAYIGWNNETILFENPSFASADVAIGTTFQLTEPAVNFERIRISWSRWSEAQGGNKTDGNNCSEYDMRFGNTIRNRVVSNSMFYAGTNEADPYICGTELDGFSAGTTITCSKGFQTVVGSTSVTKNAIYYRPWKVVGINRKV